MDHPAASWALRPTAELSTLADKVTDVAFKIGEYEGRQHPDIAGGNEALSLWPRLQPGMSAVLANGAQSVDWVMCTPLGAAPSRHAGLDPASRPRSLDSRVSGNDGRRTAIARSTC